jgi:uncharacterized protein YbjT (DUF2867 family)
MLRRIPHRRIAGRAGYRFSLRVALVVVAVAKRGALPLAGGRGYRVAGIANSCWLGCRRRSGLVMMTEGTLLDVKERQAMTSPILVTGGTGTLGRQVVPRLRSAGHDVRVLSRHPRPAAGGVELVAGDLGTGEGVQAAVEGTEIIMHLASSIRGDEAKARQLVEAAARAGTRHLVFISVVGADKIGYFASKLAAEQVIAGSGLPWTTLRATQFHDLVLLIVRQLAKLPVVPVPAGWRVQPIDPGEVADRLVELALDRPAGLVPDLGGPRIYELAELARSYLRARGRHRPILPVPLPGRAARAYRAGANLAPDRAVGRRTWEEFLAERVSPGTRSSGAPTGSR